MSESRRNLLYVAMATVSSGFLAAFALSLLPLPRVHGGQSIVELLPSACVAIALSLVVVVVGFRAGFFEAASVKMILASLVYRPLATLAISGSLAGVFESLRTPFFFLVVASVYLVNLVMETWQVQRGLVTGRGVLCASSDSVSAPADQSGGNPLC